jgi:hypothetical protein
MKRQLFGASAFELHFWRPKFPRYFIASGTDVDSSLEPNDGPDERQVNAAEFHI